MFTTCGSKNGQISPIFCSTSPWPPCSLCNFTTFHTSAAIGKLKLLYKCYIDPVKQHISAPSVRQCHYNYLPSIHYF